jgi:Domain of unknown function (DUF1330)
MPARDRWGRIWTISEAPAASRAVRFLKRTCRRSPRSSATLRRLPGAPPHKVTAFDGELPKRVTVQVWDSMEKIQAWRADPAYIALRKIGDNASNCCGTDTNR